MYGRFFLRAFTGFSIRKLACKIGISHTYWIDLEKNNRSPSEKFLNKIAEVCELPLETVECLFYNKNITKEVMKEIIVSGLKDYEM